MTNQEKLQKALAFLGSKHILTKNSTFVYKRGPTVLGQYKEKK